MKFLQYFNSNNINLQTKMQQQAKVIALCLVFSISMQMCSASAIPIWEFLTRTEKLSYLYSTFAQLVSVHCKATAQSYQPSLPVNQCKRNLLTYGNEKLQTFTDAELDRLEPYQRGANELIWSAIMRDHPSATLVTTRKPLPTPPASSIIILTQTTEHKPTNTNNPLFENDREHAYASDMDSAYGYDHDKQGGSSSTSYLTGPLVFRVRPDGTPVEEDRQRPLPSDDDFEQLFPTPPTSVSGNGRPNKHRKIATISALKQQHFTNLAVQKQLHPSFLSTQIRRRFLGNNNSDLNLAAMFADYYYGRRLI